jgi:hypothetical protein
MQMQLQSREAAQAEPAERPGWWPVRIALVDYPQLKSLAWQVQGTDNSTHRKIWRYPSPSKREFRVVAEFLGVL